VLSIIVLFAFLLLASCTDFRPTVAAEFIGSWRLTDASARMFPSDCSNLRIEFKSDGRLVSKSGELVFVTKVSVTPRDGGFLLREEIVEHNGKSNCQGKSGRYIESHFVYENYFEVKGPILRQYLGKKKERFVEFVRAETTPK
jgi:hypothetical protein